MLLNVGSGGGAAAAPAAGAAAAAGGDAPAAEEAKEEKAEEKEESDDVRSWTDYKRPHWNLTDMLCRTWVSVSSTKRTRGKKLPCTMFTRVRGELCIVDLAGVGLGWDAVPCGAVCRSHGSRPCASRSLPVLFGLSEQCSQPGMRRLAAESARFHLVIPPLCRECVCWQLTGNQIDLVYPSKRPTCVALSAIAHTDPHRTTSAYMALVQ